MSRKKGKAQKERERKKRQKRRREEKGTRKSDTTVEIEIGDKVTLAAWGPKTNRPGRVVEIDEYPDESGMDAKRYHVKWPKRDGSSTVRNYRRTSIQLAERI